MALLLLARASIVSFHAEWSTGLAPRKRRVSFCSSLLRHGIPATSLTNASLRPPDTNRYARFGTFSTDLVVWPIFCQNGRKRVTSSDVRTLYPSPQSWQSDQGHSKTPSAWP